jgi:hypothetical protein
MYIFGWMMGHVGAENGRRSINSHKSLLDVSRDNLDLCD